MAAVERPSPAEAGRRDGIADGPFPDEVVREVLQVWDAPDLSRVDDAA